MHHIEPPGRRAFPRISRTDSKCAANPNAAHSDAKPSPSRVDAGIDKRPPDREQMLRAIEARLTADERAFLRRSVARMASVQIDQLARLSPDVAAEMLRREMPRPTTRSQST